MFSPGGRFMLGGFYRPPRRKGPEGQSPILDSPPLRLSAFIPLHRGGDRPFALKNSPESESPFVPACVRRFVPFPHDNPPHFPYHPPPMPSYTHDIIVIGG